MEGTHTVLQLHRPIMEICYVSFCLPKGEVRGFTYKGCVTLDKSNKCFLNCYQVRESSEAVRSRRQTCENIGDIFFKQTTTKDILTELYKLNAEKERLLTTLLSSSHILGVNMGNQDGKLQDVSESLKYKDDENLGFWDQQESFSESIEKKSILKTKKPKKSSKRRESIEDFINKKIKRKIPAVLEPSTLNCREVLSGTNKLLSATCPVDVSSSSFAYSYPENLEGTSDVNKQPEKSRRQLHLLENSQALGSDTDLSVSFSEYDNDVVGHCFAHSSHSLLDDVENTLKGIQVQESSLLLNSFQETSVNKSEAFDKTEAPEMVHDYNRTAENLKSKPEVGVIAKEQDSEYKVQKVLSTSIEYGQIPSAKNKESEESTGSVFATATQEKKHESYIQQYKEKEDVTEESHLVGAVNKTILKVIQSDRLDETAEWKRLQHITNPTGISYDKRAVVPQENNKYSSLHLPVNLNPDICQTRTNVKQEDKRPLSPSLAAVSNVFNNSYPPSNTHKQMSPLPSPLSSRLPSPQLHHRILPLPFPETEEESLCSDYHSLRHFGTTHLSGKDLEAHLHLKFSEYGHSGLSVGQRGLHQGTSGDHFEKSNLPEKSSVQLQHQRPSGPQQRT